MDINSVQWCPGVSFFFSFSRRTKIWRIILSKLLNFFELDRIQCVDIIKILQTGMLTLYLALTGHLPFYLSIYLQKKCFLVSFT